MRECKTLLFKKSIQVLLLVGKFMTIACSVCNLSQAEPSRNAARLSPRQNAMLEALNHVSEIYLDHYAPLQFKIKKFGISLQAEYLRVRSSVLNDPNLSNLKFRQLLVGFVSAFRDYHAQISFFSTEKATLAFSIKSVAGHYYISSIDNKRMAADQNSNGASAMQIGDEIIEFGGAPIEKAVSELRQLRFPNNPNTDQALLDIQLTNRSGSRGDFVPQGSIELTLKSRKQNQGSSTEKIRKVTTNWIYSPELVPEIPVQPRPRNWLIENSIELKQMSSRRSLNRAGKSGRILIPDWLSQSQFDFGMTLKSGLSGAAQDSLLPDFAQMDLSHLGQVIWQSKSEMEFSPYIFLHPQTGQKIGYLRIANYYNENKSYEDFLKVIQFFQKSTDALIIDQMNNPGGDVNYMYALLSSLTTRPLPLFKHRFLLNEANAYSAATALTQIQSVQMGTTEEYKYGLLKKSFTNEVNNLFLPDNIGENISDFYKFILDQLDQGNRLTEPEYLIGMREITPHPKIRYDKPILVLINSLDFSCADFFPAILQDSQRARLLGSKTSGTGGSVASTSFLNQVGINQIKYNHTIAERIDGSFIENFGVVPDFPYEITLDDIQNNHQGLKSAILDALLNLH